MEEVIITNKEAQKIAEFIYQNLNDYIKENQDKFLEFLKKKGIK